MFFLFSAPALAMEAVSLLDIYKSASVLLQMGHMGNFLGPLFKLLVQEKGPKFLQNIWHSSKLSLSLFLKPNEINSFVEEYVSVTWARAVVYILFLWWIVETL